MLYWRDLQSTDASQRRWIVEELRVAVRRGETTACAWLSVVLGETDPALVREAVLGYLGGTPVSVERRERAVDDALEWIRRGLALNRVAVFVALLRLEDSALNERLSGLRGRLTAIETAAVWNAVRRRRRNAWRRLHRRVAGLRLTRRVSTALPLRLSRVPAACPAAST